MNKYILQILTFLSLFLGFSVGVYAEPVDYSTVSTGITAEIAPILTLGLAIAVAAVGIMAAPKGVRFAKRMWAAIAG